MMSETPTRCPSTATVEPGGALVRCTLDAGHDVDQPWSVPNNKGEAIAWGVESGTLHEYVLTWGNPEDVDIDADIYDPDEVFDLEVDIEPSIGGRYVCKPCTYSLHWQCSEPGVCQCLEEVDEPSASHPAMPPVPAGLCGVGGCVYIEGHALRDYSRGRHSWEF